ncbi:MAG: diguanylate cyclase [Alphaproteobacteria bacterium]|nr:diguanylate cyclase [Alphaproteobacteria bacterium]
MNMANGQQPAFPGEQQAADAAIRLMHTLGLKPEPLNYAVWYTYSAGERLDLKAELDVYLKARKPISPAINEQIFAKYIADALAAVADSASRQKLDDANDRLAKTLNAVMGLVAAAGKSGDAFGQALTKFKSEITVVADPRIEAAITAMASEAEKMAALNTKLSSELAGASQDIASLKNDLDTIRQEAYTDGLTGVANRKAFNKRIDELTSAMRAKSGHLCLLLTDIDHFKKFNDTYGHLVGDRVIKTVAKTLARSVRDQDFVARYGGEEFAVLFPATRLTNAVAAADKIRAAVCAREMQNRDNWQNLGRITVSVGVAEFAIGEKIDDLIARADTALYLAKQTGRNRVCSQADLPKR